MATNRTNNARPTAEGVDPIKPVKDETPATAPDATVSEGSAAFATGEKGKFKTSGSFVLMDPFTGKHFDETSDEEVVVTSFIVDKLNSGELIEA